MIDDEDHSEWARFTKKVVRLKESKVRHLTQSKNRNLPQKKTNQSRSTEPHFSQISLETLQDYQPKKQFLRNGISQRQFKKLQKGDLPIEAILDLHGNTLQEAEKKLLNFIYDSQHNALTCVQIIHGKGLHSARDQITLGVLVKHRLTLLNAVLAYATPAECYGGDGVVFILLKRNRCTSKIF